MPAYDSESFHPPAPLAKVTLRHPDTGEIQTDVPMLLDSGADVTLIPRITWELLRETADPNRHYELMGFDGSISYAPVVKLELSFCQRTFRGQFLLIDQACGVLGRNVLNRVPILLDGPRLVWSEYRRSG